MAIIFDNNKPLIYVDSINETSYYTEMKNILSSYIREKNIEYTIVKTHDEILGKQDGYYLVENKLTIELYKKQTNRMYYVFTNYDITKIMSLSYTKCKKTVPIILKKENTLFENFQDELKNKVGSLKLKNE
uniref:Uncharacterized protein n=1 Tax=viral metagenome TaxID=1070528 RepID=A0A6C0DYE3_9ZZZZ